MGNEQTAITRAPMAEAGHGTGLQGDETTHHYASRLEALSQIELWLLGLTIDANDELSR